ncbi:hypothetical protein SAMN05421736_101880 [Evansella caseinilytica]|uniref:Uncharacterized protein n=1 Tax=Evansella caseinilytica TaxID=1503961 RepID=A0A1H3IQ86_9BACI|nr:hypothetical protein [Evansella caseinilytica]SDY29268.1 hypothetical protein SAMN05421736_101880 [Evansella caseinilytica]
MEKYIKKAETLISSLHWYDWITPTTPYASVFFGFLFTSLIAAVIWLETKNIKQTAMAAATGLLVSLAGGMLLSAFGFYR